MFSSCQQLETYSLNFRKELVGDSGLVNLGDLPASLSSDDESLQFVLQEKPMSNDYYETSYMKVNYK